MTTVDYYPKKHRLDFIGDDGIPTNGIFGDYAHMKAAALIMNGTAIVRVCGIDSRMNKQYMRKLKAEGRRQKALIIKY
jgi:hypothetical protein